MAPVRRSAAGSRFSLASSKDQPPKQSARPSLDIPDSDPFGEDQESDQALPKPRRSQSFKGVVIPSRPRDKDTAMSKNSSHDLANSRRASNSSSSLSAVNSHSPFTNENSDVDTAETSAISTPAEPASAPQRLPKGHTFQNPFKQRASGKRKRTSADQEVNGDAALAQALQEEEYGADTSKQNNISKKRRVTIVDSDEDEIVDSDSDDIPLANLSKSVQNAKSKVTKTPKSRPGRQARDSAQKAMKKTIKAVGDSEGDDSELSDFIDDEEELASKTLGAKHYAGTSEEESDASDSEDAALDSLANGTIDFQLYATRRDRTKKENRAKKERAKLENAHPEIKTMWDELDALPCITKEEAPQPSTISRRLKGFQLEGLHWMRQQEQTRWKGGLLGDEMGMGKTIQAVSLIMSDYPTKPHQPTLVVVPPVALMQWQKEIDAYTSGQLKVLIYHGQNAMAKKLSVKELKAYDVIMISYSSLESVYRKQEKGWNRKDKIVKETSAIHDIQFHRILLDEAHSIKSRTAGVAKACFALKGSYKWCLSGTPVQNRIGEFFSLLRFLEVTPFANYFCKDCPCARIDWHTTPDYRCTACNHRTLQHVSVFNQEILNPIVAAESDDTKRKLGLKKLRMLTDHIMLRRMKRDETASMELPPKEVVIHNEFFGEIERDFSSSIMGNTSRQFDTYVSRGVMLNNYANIFGLIMQMRQVSDHPDLLLKKHSEAGQNVLVCNICDEPAEEAIRSRCKHDFCRVCAKDYVKTCEASGAMPDCPKCHIVSCYVVSRPVMRLTDHHSP